MALRATKDRETHSEPLPPGEFQRSGNREYTQLLKILSAPALPTALMIGLRVRPKRSRIQRAALSGNGPARLRAMLQTKSESFWPARTFAS